MRQYKFRSALLMTMILVGCGGGGDIPAKPKFTSHVSFGDSLSDVGTYNVGFIAQAGGGQFSINGTNANGNNITNWTEVMDKYLDLPTPCPAVTGLIGVGADAASSVAVTPNLACIGYAQGGARVTALNGIHNAANGMYSTPGGLGGAELTYPVVKQIANFLHDHGPRFSGDELVSVVVGGNDVKYQLTMVGAGAISPASAVQAMGVAAGELVGDVNTLLINGSKHVIVGSIPDFAHIPALASYPADTKGLVDLMVTTFNSTLQSGLAALPGSANVLFVDFYTLNKDQLANPGKYGLSNVTNQACDPVLTPNNRALFCKASTLIAGQTVDTRYLFSDDTHPTPYGHELFAQGVLQAMTAKGWY